VSSDHLKPAALLAVCLKDSMDVTAAVLRDEALLADASRAAALIAEAVQADKRILLFGNGGSAADAMHLAAEFVGRFKRERQAMAAISLTDNAAAMTAIANDYAYDKVFARQIEAFGARGDVAVGLSTSGRSANVVKGLGAAASRGLRTIAFTGASGGDCQSAAELCLRIPSSETARVQECTLLLCHAIFEWVEHHVMTG
jgi:D-sedoheptulose 7-phosphate isomerase